MRACVEALRCGEAHIVSVHRVGHNELIVFAEFHPIRHIIRDGVSDVFERAIFSSKLNCIARTAPCVPAARGLADDFCVKANGLVHVGLFVFGACVFVFNPLKTMAGNFPASLFHRTDLRRCTG